MALHYLLCITSCLPRKLPEVSHKVPIYKTIIFLVMESSCSVPPGTNLHNLLYHMHVTETSISVNQGSSILNSQHLALVHTCSWSVPPGTIPSFLSPGTNILNFLWHCASRSVPPGTCKHNLFSITPFWFFLLNLGVMEFGRWLLMSLIQEKNLDKISRSKCLVKSLVVTGLIKFRLQIHPGKNLFSLLPLLLFGYSCTFSPTSPLHAPNSQSNSKDLGPYFKKPK